MWVSLFRDLKRWIRACVHFYSFECINIR